MALRVEAVTAGEMTPRKREGEEAEAEESAANTRAADMVLQQDLIETKTWGSGLED